jgi:hypothetical protein
VELRDRIHSASGLRARAPEGRGPFHNILVSARKLSAGRTWMASLASRRAYAGTLDLPVVTGPVVAIASSIENRSRLGTIAAASRSTDPRIIND